MKRVKVFLRDSFLSFAVIMSLLTAPIDIWASTFVFVNNLGEHLVEVDGFPQTIQTQKHKSRKKRRSKRKIMVAKYFAVPVSTWGGDGIILNIEANGATIEYVCADGQIEHELKINGKGNFAANGIHRSGQPGPVRMDAEQTPMLATFEGKITGDTMTLQITLTESGKMIGAFTLKRGTTPRMTRCY
jgi:hypothetical protein